MQFLLVLLLLLAVQAQAVNLSFGDTFDPFASGTFFQDTTANATPVTDVDAISGIDANRTVSVNLLTGSNGIASEGSGSMSFSFNPGTATGTAGLTYAFNSALNLIGVNALTFTYDLTTNPLTMSVSIDGGAAVNYNLATGIGAQASIDLTSAGGSIASSLAISFTGFSGQNNLSISSPITAVPEPATIAGLFVLAVFLFFAYRRRQQAQPVNAAAFAA